MGVRCIYCPGISKWVPLGAYVKAVKAAKTNPDVEFRTGITTWWPTAGREIVEQFRAGLHDRINQGVPLLVRAGYQKAS